jgi:hypothetical protein
MAGTGLQELMELGGWKSYEMVLRYAHLAPDNLRTTVARFDESRFGHAEEDRKRAQSRKRT